MKGITYISYIQVLFILVVLHDIIIIHLGVNNNKHKDNNKMRYILVMEFSGYNIYYEVLYIYALIIINIRNNKDEIRISYAIKWI